MVIVLIVRVSGGSTSGVTLLSLVNMGYGKEQRKVC